MSTPPKRRPRGRPRDDEKREAIMAAAFTLFAEHGFEGVGLETVAARAGVSRKTVYGHFGDKAGLLKAIILSKTRRVDVPPAVLPGKDIREQLIAYGAFGLRAIYSEGNRALDQLITREVTRDPALARGVYRSGPMATQKFIAGLMRSAIDRGELSPSTDAWRAAGDFMSLLGNTLTTRSLLGLFSTLTKKEAQASAEHAADMVMCYYGARSGTVSPEKTAAEGTE